MVVFRGSKEKLKMMLFYYNIKTKKETIFKNLFLSYILLQGEGLLFVPAAQLA